MSYESDNAGIVVDANLLDDLGTGEDSQADHESRPQQADDDNADDNPGPVIEGVWRQGR